MPYICINNSMKRFSGYEQSPLGLGYSATGFELGHCMEGRDQNIWTVVKNENKHKHLYERKWSKNYILTKKLKYNYD